MICRYVLFLSRVCVEGVTGGGVGDRGRGGLGDGDEGGEKMRGRPHETRGKGRSWEGVY